MIKIPVGLGIEYFLMKSDILSYLLSVDSDIIYPHKIDINAVLDPAVETITEYASIKTRSWFFDLYRGNYVIQADETHELFLLLKYQGSTAEDFSSKIFDIR